MRLGVCYLALSRAEDAALSLQKAVALKPYRASYHYLLGEVYRALGSELQALIHYERAGELGAYDRDQVERVRRASGLDSAPAPPSY
jgi:tetratricopeptide (TPR) repeat protein